MNSTEEYINIHRLIKDSNSKFLKGFPYFVIRLIKLIIRQNEINRILNKYAVYEGIDFLPIVAAVHVFGTNPRRYLLELEKIFASDKDVVRSVAEVPKNYTLRLHYSMGITLIKQ